LKKNRKLIKQYVHDNKKVLLATLSIYSD